MTQSTERPAKAARPSVDSELTWLLHRAAQRMRGVSGEQAEEHGLALRDYIVLSAIDRGADLTQAELARELSLDKTTLMHQLDSLERRGLVRRRSDPRDRRIRIPECTPAGIDLCAEVARSCVAAESAIVEPFSAAQVATLRRMLVEIIGTSDDRGSCL